MITKITFKVHFLFYIVSFICFITGLFKDFIIFSSIILIHELGHVLVALLFKWNIEKVILLPFGGITIFKEHIDKPLIQELLIALAGPFFQILFYFIFNDNLKFCYYNNIILVFNLLPIFPLDGSKIINVLINYVFSFKKSHIISLTISYMTLCFILFVCVLKYNVSFILIMFFIILEVIKETYKHKYYFNKFVLERYLYDFKFKKRKQIYKLEQMKKQTRHIFKINNNYYTERDFIRKTFDK